MKRKMAGRLAALLALLLALLLTGIFAAGEGQSGTPGDPPPAGEACPETGAPTGGVPDLEPADPGDPEESNDPAREPAPTPANPEPTAAPAEPTAVPPAQSGAEPREEADANPAVVYAVRFLVGEGESEAVFAVLSLAEGEPVPAPESVPEAEGLVFVHWYDARGAAEIPFPFACAVTEALTLRALFAAEPVLPEEPPAGPEDGAAEEPVIIIIPDNPIPLAGPKETVPDDSADDMGGFDVPETDETPDADETPETDETPDATPDVGALAIDFHMDVPDGFQIGDDIVFHSVLDGFEGLDVALQWQVKTPGGDWRDIDGATGASYTLHTNSENVAYMYRVTATARP